MSIELKELIKDINLVNKLIKWKAFIAGGCCRSILENEPPKDIDIFLYDQKDYLEVVEILSKNLIEYETSDEEDSNLVWENDLVKNFESNSLLLVQLVKPSIKKYMRTWGEPEEVIWTFDFTVCRFYLEEYEESDENIESLSEFPLERHPDDYNQEFNTSSYEDIDNKILFVKNIVCPISSIRRAMKYAWYWYYLPIQELLKLLKEIENRKMPLDELMETAKEDLYSLMQHFD